MAGVRRIDPKVCFGSERRHPVCSLYAQEVAKQQRWQTHQVRTVAQTPRKQRRPGNASLTRRDVLAQALVAAGLLTLDGRVLAAASAFQSVPNITGLYSVQVGRIETPRSAMDVSELVRSYPGKMAVGGGRYSMGGQMAVRNGLHIDMRQMNGLVWIRPTERQVRVQAGMRWRDLQDHLDRHGLAVRVMQSYANFTVGGSVAVNVHGRYVGQGPVGNTVRALQLILADGSQVEATSSTNSSLFRASIGGYGAVAVITEVELELADNVQIEKAVERVTLDDYVGYFKAKVLGSRGAVLHNADLFPPNFVQPVCTTWTKSIGKALTVTERLVPRNSSYGKEQNAIWATSELPGGAMLRQSVLQPLAERPEVKWLNHEASMDVAQLEPRTRAISTYVLQEYFVPGAHLVDFVRGMAQVIRVHGANVLNVSIRHSPADTVSLLPWAKSEVFSLVLYYKQRTRQESMREVERWTRALIDLALQHGGRYYLPYQLHATQAQFAATYPEIADLQRVKAQFDPSGRFSNELWRKYM